MFKKTFVSNAVAIVMTAGLVGAAQADVVAQSILSITGLTIIPSNPSAITSIAGANQGSVSVTLNGSTLANNSTVPFIGTAAAPIVDSRYIGTPGYTAFTPTIIGASPTGTFGSSSVDLGGTAVGGGANARTDATISIIGNGSGTASSTLGVAATYTILTTQASSLTFNFFADPFMRAFVDPLFSAQAGIGFSVNILGPNNSTVFNWTPDGSAGGILGGLEIYDPCSLNTGLSQTFSGEQFYDPTCANPSTSGGAVGQFQAITNIFAAGAYNVRISHFSNASAISENRIPEPSSLLLSSLALLGLGAVARRKTRG